MTRRTYCKALSALSLAFALQAGALVAATVIIAPSDAAAATRSKAKPQKKSQKKAPARGKIKTKFDVGDPGGPQDNLPRRDKPCCKGVPDLQKPPPSNGNLRPSCETNPDLCRNTASKRH